mmetsp:Transcript_39836/g.62636  ORF Transcript_39836/g.62636 Transcript_39836/m.62636 type:complete len:246 (+) Transcript_39836:415-1152(+)
MSFFLSLLLLLICVLSIGILLVLQRRHLHQEVLQDSWMLGDLGAAAHQHQLSRFQCQPFIDFFPKKAKTKLLTRHESFQDILGGKASGKPSGRMFMQVAKAKATCQSKDILVHLGTCGIVLPISSTEAFVNVVKNGMQGLGRRQAIHMDVHLLHLLLHLFDFSLLVSRICLLWRLLWFFCRLQDLLSFSRLWLGSRSNLCRFSCHDRHSIGLGFSRISGLCHICLGVLCAFGDTLCLGFGLTYFN